MEELEEFVSSTPSASGNLGTDAAICVAIPLRLLAGLCRVQGSGTHQRATHGLAFVLRGAVPHISALARRLSACRRQATLNPIGRSVANLVAVGIELHAHAPDCGALAGGNAQAPLIIISRVGGVWLASVPQSSRPRRVLVGVGGTRGVINQSRPHNLAIREFRTSASIEAALLPNVPCMHVERQVAQARMRMA